MLTLNKTKAALQSCQCHYEKPKQIKHTGVNAGGQSLNRAQEYALQRNQRVKKISHQTNNVRYLMRSFLINSMPFISLS